MEIPEDAWDRHVETKEREDRGFDILGSSGATHSPTEGYHIPGREPRAHAYL
jgi:hypothetical protein